MKLLLFFTLLFSYSVWAQKIVVTPLETLKTAKGALAIGSKMYLQFAGKKQEMTFLGRMVHQDGTAEDFLFLDEQKTRVYLIDYKNIEMKSGKSKAQAILRPMDQFGGTCAAYSFIHFWQQMYWADYKGTAEFDHMMSDERERLKLLEESLGRYYLDRRGTTNSIMTSYGKRFGFKCKSSHFTDPKKAADFVFQKAKDGKPVIVDFNLGPDMVTSSYELQDYETKKLMDPRLWIPRTKSQKNAGGHSIAAAAAFVAKGRRKLLVLDSDWSEPRVWDLDSYIGAKTIVEEMGFYSCN